MNKKNNENKNYFKLYVENIKILNLLKEKLRFETRIISFFFLIVITFWFLFVLWYIYLPDAALTPKCPCDKLQLHASYFNLFDIHPNCTCKNLEKELSLICYFCGYFSFVKMVSILIQLQMCFIFIFEFILYFLLFCPYTSKIFIIVFIWFSIIYFKKSKVEKIEDELNKDVESILKKDKDSKKEHDDVID